MDGDFFMKRIKRWFILALVVLCLTYGSGLLRDRAALDNKLVRLHVVGQSDSPEDQSLKLQVRDAVVEHLGSVMSNCTTAEEAITYLQGHLQELKTLARQVLTQHGSEAAVEVSLGQEQFPAREYDTFRLPAGVYESLRITIGEGQGKNWWCVLFPRLLRGIPGGCRGGRVFSGTEPNPESGAAPAENPLLDSGLAGPAGRTVFGALKPREPGGTPRPVPHLFACRR